MQHLYKGQLPCHYTGFQDFLFCKGKKSAFSLFFFSFSPLPRGKSCFWSQDNSFYIVLVFWQHRAGQQTLGHVSVQGNVPVMAKNGNQPNDQLLVRSLPSAEYWVTPRTGCSAYLSPSPHKKMNHYQSLDSYLVWSQASPVTWTSFTARQHFQEQVDLITATDPSTLLTSDVIPHCVARWNLNCASVVHVIMVIAYSDNVYIYSPVFCSATDGRAYIWHHKREQSNL